MIICHTMISFFLFESKTYVRVLFLLEFYLGIQNCFRTCLIQFIFPAKEFNFQPFKLINLIQLFP